MSDGLGRGGRPAGVEVEADIGDHGLHLPVFKRVREPARAHDPCAQAWRTWVSAVMKLDGKRLKTKGHAPITALVDLKGFPKGRFVLSITARTSDGRTVSGTRTYHTCVPVGKPHKTPKI